MSQFARFMFGLFGPPSPKKFAALITKKIAELGGPTDFVFDEKTNTLKRPSQIANLGNVYADYCQAKSSEIRTRLLVNFATAFIAQGGPEKSFEDIRPHLVAVIREQVLFSFSAFQWGLDIPEKQIAAITSEPVSPWFSRALVLDYPGHMAIVNEDDIKSWGISTDEAFAIGIENLTGATTPKFSHKDGVYTSQWNDDYDSSRILIPGLFEDLPIKGDPVVVMPNRLTLLVAGSDDPDAILRMIAQAEEVLQTKPRPQNMALLIIKGELIQEYSVSVESPIFNAVERARKIAAMNYYAEQKHLLDSSYEKSGKDIFVSNFTLMREEKAQREFYSYCMWARGLAALLPVTDDVMFFDPEKPEGAKTVARCNWSRVRAVLGDLMLDTKMYPPRYYVSKFPTPEQLRTLNENQ